MEWKTRAWAMALALACALSSVAYGAPPTSRPTQRTTKSSPQGKVFVGLKRLRRLLKKRRYKKYNSVIPHRAHYTGTLDKGWLRVSASLTLQRTSITRSKRFSIGGRGGIIYNVTVQGQSHAPRRDPWGIHWIRLPQTMKPIIVTYTYGLQVPAARGEHKLQLDLPRCPQATLQLQFAGKGWELHTLPASRVSLKESRRGTHATLQLPGQGRLWLKWKGKRIERREKTRFRVNLESLLTLKEGLVQGQVQLHLELLTGAIRSVRFSLPAQVEVLHAGGEGVVEWFQSGQSKRERQYTIQLSRAIRKRHTLKLRFELTRKRKTNRVFLPHVRIIGAEQSTGFVGVLAKADTEVSHDSVRQGQQVDVRSLPYRIRRQSTRPILLAYRSSHPSPTIHVKMVRHPQLKVMKTVINRARFETVRTRTGREVIKATYWVTNNRRQFMPVVLPKGADIIGAFVAGYPIQPAQQPAKGKGKRYLLPLIRSSRKQSKRSFPVELLYTQKRAALARWGYFVSKLPTTPIQILSYQWDYYIPTSHKQIWLGGSARSGLQGRFMKRLFRRMGADLREGTPVLWAGGRKWGKRRRVKLNVYNFKGLKERFANPAASPNVSPISRSYRYKSRFAKAQWQVRAKMPLVGRKLTFRGHLVRNRAPSIKVWYLKHELSQYWFWCVLLLTMFGGVLFLSGLFRTGNVAWGRVVFAVVLWGTLFAAGYVLPLTYLAGFRGILFGFWGAILLGLATLPTERRWVGKPYLVFAKGLSVAITFSLLLFGGVNAQVVCLFLATPIYPALIRKRKEGGDA